MRYKIVGKKIYAIEDDNSLTLVTNFKGDVNLIAELRTPLNVHKEKKEKEKKEKEKQDKKPKVKTSKAKTVNTVNTDIPKKRG